MFLNGGSSSRNQQFLHIGLNILAFCKNIWLPLIAVTMKLGVDG